MLWATMGRTGRAPQPARFYTNSQANPDRRPSEMTENRGPNESWELSRDMGSVTKGSCMVAGKVWCLQNIQGRNKLALKIHPSMAGTHRKTLFCFLTQYNSLLTLQHNVNSSTYLKERFSFLLWIGHLLRKDTFVPLLKSPGVKGLGSE